MTQKLLTGFADKNKSTCFFGPVSWVLFDGQLYGSSQQWLLYLVVVSVRWTSWYQVSIRQTHLTIVGIHFIHLDYFNIHNRVLISWPIAMWWLNDSMPLTIDHWHFCAISYLLIMIILNCQQLTRRLQTWFIPVLIRIIFKCSEQRPRSLCPSYNLNIAVWENFLIHTDILVWPVVNKYRINTVPTGWRL